MLQTSFKIALEHGFDFVDNLFSDCYFLFLFYYGMVASGHTQMAFPVFAITICPFRILVYNRKEKKKIRVLFDFQNGVGNKIRFKGNL